MAYFVDRVKRTKAKINDTGMLDAPAFVARVGVQTYHRPDGSPFRVLRPPEEVFAPESLDTYALATVTDDHPAQQVTADNAKALSVGTVGAATREGDYVSAPIRLTDAGAVERFRAGKNQLSSGYTAVLTDAQPGSVWTDSAGKPHPYDAVQSKIRVNHVAMVDIGRAGPEVRIYSDSQTFVCTDADDAAEVVQPPTPRKLMEKIVLDGVTVEVDAAVKKAVESSIAKITGELDAVKARLAATEKEFADATDTKRIAGLVKARVELESRASKFVTDGLSEKTDREIRLAALKVLAPAMLCDGKSDEYVTAAFDALAATAAPVDHAAQKIVDAVTVTAPAPTTAEEQAAEYRKQFTSRKF